MLGLTAIVLRRIKMKRLIFAVLLITSFQAYAIPITTTVGDYDITTITGTFEDVLGQIDDQVWWNNQTLASEFAGLVQDTLGILNPFDFGPLFAYSWFDTNGDGLFRTDGDSYSYSAWCVDPSPFGCGAGRVGSFTASRQVDGPNTEQRVWAIGRQTSVPLPGTLALFGLGLAGLGWSRRKKA